MAKFFLPVVAAAALVLPVALAAGDAHAAGGPSSLPPFVADRTVQIAAAVFLGVAVLHTFLVKQFNALAHKCLPGSIGENVFHFLGEVEVVFGIWAGILVSVIGFRSGMPQALAYLDQEVDFTEASFVFVIMVMSATRPVIWLAERLIRTAASLLPFMPGRAAFYVAALAVGPLLGSLITEPAAMTVTALLLKKEFYDREPRMSAKFMYATLGLLFVNISIGGTLTQFAAPPVLMVAGPWGWDAAFMLRMFGWKAAVAVIVGAVVTALVFRKELRGMGEGSGAGDLPTPRPPILLVGIHLAFMAATVAFHSHVKFFFPLFLFFIGICKVTSEYQNRLQIREGLLVSFFLGGLVTLGGLQGWWLKPILSALTPGALFFGAAGLTAFTDNAAITFLGTQVPNLSDTAKYMLVAGAVSGGGLTVIANAPNPAGFGILKESFGSDGISPWLLMLGALPYTLLAVAAFLIAP